MTESENTAEPASTDSSNAGSATPDTTPSVPAPMLSAPAKIGEESRAKQGARPAEQAVTIVIEQPATKDEK